MSELTSGGKKSSRKIVWIGAAAVVLTGLVWWGVFHAGSQVEGKIETDAVTRGELRETVSATGALQALETIPVGTQVSGTIDKLLVDFNDKVKKGQLLATLDPSVLDSQLESARAALDQAKARNADAISQLKEGEGLLQKAYISDKDLRTLKVNVTTTTAQVDSAAADYNRAKRSREYADVYSPIDGVVIERAVDRGQTVASGFQTPTLFTIARDLHQMQIVATVDESQIGSVKIGQSASFTVSAFPGKRFPASVKQIRLKPTTIQNVVTYQVVLGADNSQGELFPGMTATVDFVLKEFDDTLRVASAALRIQRVPDELQSEETKQKAKEREKEFASMRNGDARPSGAGEVVLTPEQIQAMRQRAQQGGARAGNRTGISSVWVMQDDGKLNRVAVRILASDLSRTAVEPVRGGLKEGDKIVTKLPAAQAQSAAPRSVFGTPAGPQGGGFRPR
jgi:HlyD family secretion protein